jgi:hypothetical protein
MKWAEFLIGLYPKKWRNRYQDEFLALMEQEQMKLSVIFNIILGAIDAHINWVGDTMNDPYLITKLHLRVFQSFMFSIVAAFLIYGAVDDSSFVIAMKANFWFKFFYNLVWVGYLATFAPLFVLGIKVLITLPLKKKVRVLFGPVIPVVCFVIVAVVIAGMNAKWIYTPDWLVNFEEQHVSFVHGIMELMFLTVFPVSSFIVSKEILHSNYVSQKFEMAMSFVSTFGMLFITFATLIWGMAGMIYAPHTMYYEMGIFNMNNFATWCIALFITITTSSTSSLSIRRTYKLVNDSSIN